MSVDINGKKIKRGDVLIGFTSDGLHTNGYSLARKVLFPKYKLNVKPKGLKNSIGKELLKVHKSYLSLIKLLKSKIDVKGFSHITGGGIVGNTKRILPNGRQLNIDWHAWELPKIFQIIQDAGKITDEEMRSVFNLGIGLVAVVSKSDVKKVEKLSLILKEKAIIIGEVI